MSDEVLDDETAYMQFAVADDEVIQIPVNQSVEILYNNETNYVFTCVLNAKEMTDDVESEFFYTGSTTGEYIYEVKAYADSLIIKYETTPRFFFRADSSGFIVTYDS